VIEEATGDQDRDEQPPLDKQKQRQQHRELDGQHAVEGGPQPR
jgi:hypothetical protein